MGWEEGVFFGGEEIGTIHRYSDSLMVCLLAAHRPKKFGKNARVEHSGDIKIVVEYADLDDHAAEAAPGPDADPPRGEAV
jgi:hypothetical protein